MKLAILERLCLLAAALERKGFVWRERLYLRIRQGKERQRMKPSDVFLLVGCLLAVAMEVRDRLKARKREQREMRRAAQRWGRS